MQNDTPYGLTAGLHSLDRREHCLWLHSIKAGNCYINRGITGAVVGRQPFGGCKESSFGMGLKIGGPNYLPSESAPTPQETVLPAWLCDWIASSFLGREEKEEVRLTASSYWYWWQHYFCRTHRLYSPIGQENSLYFTPKSPLYVYITQETPPKAELLYKIASHITNSPAIFISELHTTHHGVLRTYMATPLPVADFAFIDICPPCKNGKEELMHWLREVCLSYDYHRYGAFLNQTKDNTYGTNSI